MALKTSYHWHPEIHETWAKEHLYFWKLSFSPTYDRERVVAGIRVALERQGATAFTVYELFAGGFDIFLRVWLPTSQGAFENDLHEALGSYTLISQAFWVNRVISYWPWESEPGNLDIRQVPANVLRNRLPDAEISKINRRALTKAKREEYEGENLIAPLKRRKGIKFFTAISTHNQAFTAYATQRLETRIKEVLRAAEKIEEKSLYAGVGFGQYLILGRTKDYFAIERELTGALNDAVDPAVYGARTITFPVSREDFLDACYDLRTEDKPSSAHSASEALAGDESQTVEVKGSAFASLKRWLHRGEAPAYEDAVADSLLRAITGLLNADGGTVVIGALERGRYDGHEKLADRPRLGSYVVCGIGEDVDGKDWDRWERRLWGLIESRIQPSAMQWIAISGEEIEGQPVGLVSVKAGNRWFYHLPAENPRPHFWVRQGNRTNEKAGPEGDDYRAEKAR